MSTYSATLITLAKLRKLCVHLSPQRFAYLVQGLLKLPPAAPLIRDHQLLLALADWLAFAGVGDARQQQILTRCRDRVTEWCQAYHEDENKALAKFLPAMTLTLSGDRYVAWTGSQKWLDLITDELIDEMPQPAVTHVICDVTALYTRLREELDRDATTRSAGPAVAGAPPAAS